MTETTYQALVVDDDDALRKLTIRALRNEGFECDWACNGNEAQAYLRRRTYDVVVTDLVMPEKHGHSVATQLLEEPDPPLVVVLTGCLEPKLTKDLLLRGVDDVSFKPVDFPCFAAKVFSLVKRRAGSSLVREKQEASTSSVSPSTKPSATSGFLAPISLDDFEKRLTRVPQLLPLSSVAIDVYALSQSENTDPGKLVGTLLRDPALSAEILRLANSAYYNRTLQQTLDVEEAVFRIGYRKIGEIALAMSALGIFRSSLVPWMDTQVACERSLAASIVLERLVDARRYEELGDGITLGVFLHTLGRVVLGTVFQQEYEQLVRLCRQTLRPLVDLERQMFPESHTAALSRVLLHWNFPINVCGPVRYLAERFSSLTYLEEPTRTKVELMKLAIFIGQLAVGRWMEWDQIEIPPANLVAKWHVHDVTSLVEQTRCDLAKLTDRSAEFKTANRRSAESAKQLVRIAYQNFSPDTVDLLAPVLPSLGIEPTDPSDPESVPGIILANCLHADAARVASYGMSEGNQKTLLMVERDASKRFDELGTVLRLPASFAAIKSRLQTEIAQ